jgi:serine/threonine protein kinase
MASEEIESTYRTLIKTRVGEYVIEDLIGAGGQAVVFRAHHVYFVDDPRALKIFGLTGTDIGGLEAGLDEAKKATSVRHQSVMLFYDPGTAEIEFAGSTRNVLYIPMQLSTLGNCDDNPPFKGKSLSELDLLTIKSLFDGLKAIHDREIIHDDIKPANILRFDESVDGEMRTILRITDFGIARLLSVIGGQTNAASAMTLPYAAPERFNHKRSKKSDIYSMGATVFYMITGKCPILPGEGMYGDFVAWRIAHEKNPRPIAGGGEEVSCPRRLALLLVRMMNPDPSERPELDECQKELQKIIELFKGRVSGFPIPSRLEKQLSRRQFPTRYIADFQGMFKPSVHKISEMQLFVVRIKMGHIVFSEYRRLIEFLIRRFSDCFCLYETWGLYDINMFIWSQPRKVENLQALLEEAFHDSEVEICKANVVSHFQDAAHRFHGYDRELSEDAHPIYALAIQDSIHLPNLDRNAYLCDEFNLVPEHSIRAFTYVESAEHPLKIRTRRTIIANVRERMAEMMNSPSQSTPRFHRISIIELLPETDPTVLLVEFVMSEYRYLQEVPTAIIGLDLRLKTSTFIATTRIVIQSNKILFE